MFQHQRGLALIRHTRPAISAGVCYGSTDIPALPFDADADALVATIAAWGPARIVSSDLSRCRVLAETIAAATGAPMAFDSRLRELDFGAWERVAWDDVPRDALDRWAADPLGFCPPGGESGAALLARVTAFHAEMSGGDGRVAIVAHGGPLRVLSALAEGVPIDLLRPPPAVGSVTFFG